MSCTRWVKDYMGGTLEEDVFQWVATHEEHEPLGYVFTPSNPLLASPQPSQLFMDGVQVKGRFCVCKHCRLVYFEAAT